MIFSEISIYSDKFFAFRKNLLFKETLLYSEKKIFIFSRNVLVFRENFYIPRRCSGSEKTLIFVENLKLLSQEIVNLNFRLFETIVFYVKCI